MAELIVVAAAGAAPGSLVEPVIGRADYFLFFDAGGAFVRAEANPHRDLSQGSGQLWPGCSSRPGRGRCWEATWAPRRPWPCAGPGSA